MPSIKRCVFGCITKGITIHNFPSPIKDQERFKLWVKIVGKPLIGLSDQQIYEKKKVCSKHFADKDYNRNSRLNALAVPSLHLPQIPDDPLPSLDIRSQAVSLTSNEIVDVAPSTSDQTLISIPSTSRMLLQSEISHDRLPSSEIRSQAVSTTSNEIVDVAPSVSEETLSIPSTSRMLLQSGRDARFKNRGYMTTQKCIRDLKREILRLRKSRQNLKTRLEMIQKMNNSTALERVTKRMNLSSKIFTKMLFRQAGKKPRGRRFTLKEKILALSFYKRSPKSYTLLSKCFTVPAAKTLRNLLGKIEIHAGINKPIFEKIKENVEKMTFNEKLCILIFDEMHINPQIHYDSKKDELKGFDSFKKQKIADHVLTFMVRGISKKFKQPVAYYFTQNLTKFELKAAIKEVVREVNATGLKLIGTVCDQSTVNVGAIESLVNDSKELYLRNGREWQTDVIIIDETEIIPLYDVPHLIKGIRNNLITKHLKYINKEDNTEKIIKWEYFLKLYNADLICGELKILQKITEEHIIPEKINKMKVRLATQLFSHSVAIATNHLCDAGKLDPACKNLIPFVLILDKLFDSLNASTFVNTDGKIFRSGVKRNSPHHKLWQEGIEFLKNIKFFKEYHGNLRLKEYKVPSIKNFIKTIEGMQAIWKLVNNRYGLQCMLTRHFNQDPVENFFGSIRSLGVRNVSPNVINFEGAYKSLLLNNFSSSQSIKSNCEDDSINTYFQSLDFLLKNSQNKTVNSNADLLQEINISEEILQINDKIQEAGLQQRSYVCGWVVRKCLKNICKTCKPCRRQLLSNKNIEANNLIKAKEYCNKKWLVYPSLGIHKYFNDIQIITTQTLKENFSTSNIKKNIKDLNVVFTDFNFECNVHKNNLKKFFEESVINVLIYSWCRSINRILSGKITYDGDDNIKTSAQLYYNKHKHNKNVK